MEEYFEDRPWSFGSARAVKEHNRELKNEDIENFLSKNEIYTRFKQHRKASQYSPIYVYRKRELFQADVVFFTNENIVAENNGFKYMFTCIDCFTKMAWVYPMKTNRCATVMQCFQDILKKCGKKPERLNSDRGSELICKSFKDFLAKQNIHHYLSYSSRKCPIVERFNLTIQNILYKIMASKRSWKWTKFLDQAMTIYFHGKHSTIGMSPIDAEKTKNSSLVRQNLLKFFRKNRPKKKEPKYKVGAKVRIWKARHTFQRGYDENYSREYFKIREIKLNLPVPRYILEDATGDIITGSFFEDELVRFEPDDLFEIEIVKKRKKGKKIECLVHYLGYPKSMNQWIPEEELEKL